MRQCLSVGKNEERGERLAEAHRPGLQAFQIILCDPIFRAGATLGSIAHATFDIEQKVATGERDDEIHRLERQIVPLRSLLLIDGDVRDFPFLQPDGEGTFVMIVGEHAG